MNATDMKRKSDTNWTKLESMDDEDIDFTDIPPLDDSFFDNAVLRLPKKSFLNTIQIDSDILDWFKAEGNDYQKYINKILRNYIEMCNVNKKG